MRTTLLWTVSQYALCRGGVCPGGCLPRGVSAQGGVCSGGVCSGGCLPGGVADTPLGSEVDTPVDRMTDMCKNITLSQLRCGR